MYVERTMNEIINETEENLETLDDRENWERLFGRVEDEDSSTTREERVFNEEKHEITIFHKGEKNSVSWYVSCSVDDIQEAVLGACESLANFESSSISLTRVDSFERLESDKFGFVEDRGEYVLGYVRNLDRIPRRLKIRLDPLKHVEARYSIQKMQRGTNLLKHTQNGQPHLRQFQLCSSCEKLVWYSQKSSMTQIETRRIKELFVGEAVELKPCSTISRRCRISTLRNLTFRIVYERRREDRPLRRIYATIFQLKEPDFEEAQLEVTTKTEHEFDYWVLGLTALIYRNKEKKCSKEEIMEHSSAFQKSLKEGNFNFDFRLGHEVNQTSLQDCVDVNSKYSFRPRESMRPSFISSELMKIKDLVRERVFAIKQKFKERKFEERKIGIEDIEFFEMQEIRVKSIFDEIEMHFDLTDKKIENIRQTEKFEIISQESKEMFFAFWKIEVEIENLEDILHSQRGDSASLADDIVRTTNDCVDQFVNYLDDVFP